MTEAVAINVTPVGNRIVVRPHDPTSETDSGIVIPESAQKSKPSRGTAVAVGFGYYLSNGDFKELTVHVGDDVEFDPYSAHEIEVDGEALLVISEPSVFLIY